MIKPQPGRVVLAANIHHHRAGGQHGGVAASHNLRVLEPDGVNEGSYCETDQTDLGNILRREQARVSSQWKEPLWVPMVTWSIQTISQRLDNCPANLRYSLSHPQEVHQPEVVLLSVPACAAARVHMRSAVALCDDQICCSSHSALSANQRAVQVLQLQQRQRNGGETKPNI